MPFSWACQYGNFDLFWSLNDDNPFKILYHGGQGQGQGQGSKGKVHSGVGGRQLGLLNWYLSYIKGGKANNASELGT